MSLIKRAADIVYAAGIACGPRFDHGAVKVGQSVLLSRMPMVLRAAVEDGFLSEIVRFSIAKSRRPAADARVIQYARARTGDLIEEWGDSSRRALAEIIATALGRGWGEATTARIIGISGIGITERQAVAIENYRAALEDSEQDLSDAQIERRVEQLTRRYARERALGIARYEMRAARRAGQQIAWEQAVRDGDLLATTRQQWIAKPTACDGCAELDGESVPLGMPFESAEFGDLDGPPAHPTCQCELALEEH